VKPCEGRSNQEVQELQAAIGPQTKASKRLTQHCLSGIYVMNRGSLSRLQSGRAAAWAMLKQEWIKSLFHATTMWGGKIMA
jgi:hypothetical protein